SHVLCISLIPAHPPPPSTLFPYTTLFRSFPIAANKPALKGPSGHFEVLQRHWVIFTRNVEPSYKQDTVPTAEQSQKWEELWVKRSEEHTSELQSRFDLVCRLLLEKKTVIY